MGSEGDIHMVEDLLSTENENLVPLHDIDILTYSSSGMEKKIRYT